MNKININGLTQEANCEQLDAIAHDYLSIQTTLDDESYGCRAGATISLPTTITASDGVYNDTKEALEDMGVTVSGTEYVRILDDAVISVLNNNGIGSGKMIPLSTINALTSIQNWFSGNTSIVDMTWLKYTSITNIVYNNWGSMRGCSNITKVEFPNTLTFISANCYNTACINGVFKELDLKKVSSIGTGALSGLSSLMKIYIRIPISFGNSALSGTNIKNIVVDSISTLLKCTGGDYWSCPFCGGNAQIYLSSDESTPISNIVVPDDVTSINSYLFCNSNIESIILNDNITSIGKGAFADSIKLVNIGNNNKIPNSVVSLDIMTFCNCNHLTNIDLNNITTLGNSDDSRLHCNYNNGVFCYCTSLSDITANKLEVIGSAAFECCTSLEEIKLPNVTTIRSAAFYGCSKLTKVYLPNNVPSLDKSITVFNNIIGQWFPSTTYFYVSSEEVKALYLADSNWSTYSSRFVVDTEWDPTAY